MAKIKSPNKDYTGVSASVPFCNGVGETENPNLIQWFKEHGYQVEEAPEKASEEVAEKAEKPVKEKHTSK